MLSKAGILVSNTRCAHWKRKHPANPGLASETWTGAAYCVRGSLAEVAAALTHYSLHSEVVLHFIVPRC